MNEIKVFCEECRDDVSFTIINKKMEGIIKGKKYEYHGQIACCDVCNSEVYLPEINDANLTSLYDVYREKNDIIPLSHIMEIPKKYSIGKRPLSLLLGWGELTFSRYFDGDIPSKQYSEILKRIYHDPHYYGEILEKNKENLPSKKTHIKSRKALDSILGSLDQNVSKIDLVVEYILNRFGDITPLALQKTLYYTQGFYNAFNGKFLFDDDCEAWVHGPVYPKVYNKYRDYRFDPIKRVEAFDSSVFTKDEIDIIDSVITNICCYSGKILEEFTHMESPWVITRNGLKDLEGSNRVIDKELIKEFFVSVKEQYNMRKSGDISNYTKDLFQSRIK